MTIVKRPKLTDEEKDLIYVTLTEAKAEDKDIKATELWLADELGASYHTIRNIMTKLRASNYVPFKDRSEEQLAADYISLDEVEKPGLEIPISFEEEKTGEQAIPLTESINLENNSELLFNVLLDRIEKLTSERDDWKNKAITLESEVAKREAERNIIASLLSNK